MRICVLGLVGVSENDTWTGVRGPKERALLAALTLDAGQAVSMDRLVEILWDGRPPATAIPKVEAHVSALRHLIGQHNTRAGPVVTRPYGYELELTHVDLDLTEFQGLGRRAYQEFGTGNPITASNLFAEALALWRGPAFADVDSPMIRRGAIALDGQRLLAVEKKAEADLTAGYHEVAVAEIGVELAKNPTRERLRALLMLGLYWHGCRSDALAVYRDGREIMVAELGLEPSQELQSLHDRILREHPVLLPGQLPWAQSAEARERALRPLPGSPTVSRTGSHLRRVADQ